MWLPLSLKPLKERSLPICGSCLQLLSLSPFELTHDVKMCKIRAGSDLGKWSVQASKQANKHTHAVCNEVTLVWGSLRLTSITTIIWQYDMLEGLIPERPRNW